MAPTTSALLVIHVVLVMTGYAGLIASNLWLLVLCRNAGAPEVGRAVAAWRTLARTFGPILGVGVLAGLALAVRMGMPLTALRLLFTYGLIVLALGAQAAIMIPWQLRAQSIVARGETPSTGPILAVVSALTIAYVAIAALMLLRPM